MDLVTKLQLLGIQRRNNLVAEMNKFYETVTADRHQSVENMHSIYSVLRNEIQDNYCMTSRDFTFLYKVLKDSDRRSERDLRGFMKEWKSNNYQR